MLPYYLIFLIKHIFVGSQVRVYVPFNSEGHSGTGSLQTKVIWSNKEKLVDPTMANLTNKVS